MHIFQNLNQKSFINKSILMSTLMAILSFKVLCTDEASLDHQVIDIFRKEIPKSELATIEFSSSKRGKKAVCHLSNNKEKTIWIDKEVLNKIEESAVLEALQKGYRDADLRCNFIKMNSKPKLLNGIIAYPKEGQIVFYDVISKEQ